MRERLKAQDARLKIFCYGNVLGAQASLPAIQKRIFIIVCESMLMIIAMILSASLTSLYYIVMSDYESIAKLYLCLFQ